MTLRGYYFLSWLFRFRACRYLLMDLSYFFFCGYSLTWDFMLVVSLGDWNYFMHTTVSHIIYKTVGRRSNCLNLAFSLAWSPTRRFGCFEARWVCTEVTMTSESIHLSPCRNPSRLFGGRVCSTTNWPHEVIDFWLVFWKRYWAL